MKWIKDNVSIINHGYTFFTGLGSFYLLSVVNSFPVEVATISAGFISVFINYFKDKINKHDDSTDLGKLTNKKIELEHLIGNLKLELETKDALIIHMRSEIVNNSTGNKSQKEAKEFLTHMSQWCMVEHTFNKASNASSQKLDEYKQKFEEFKSNQV